jgi:tetratricopeptide (TPR) repeat protein
VPLYVEELTRAVVEAGNAVPTSALPPSLQGALMARLDKLSAAKEVAQIGAVIGRQFSYATMAALVRPSGSSLTQTLDQLVASGLASRRGTPPDAIYTFKHALVQNAAYESLPRARRSLLHARLVEVLRTQEPGIEDSRPDVLSHHYEHAGALAEAADYGTRAGWQSVARGAYVEGRSQFNRVLRFVRAMPGGTERDHQEMLALSGLGAVVQYQESYGSPEYGCVQRRAAELWHSLGQPPEHVGIVRNLWSSHVNRGDIETALMVARELFILGDSRNDPRYQIMGQLVFGYTTAIAGTSFPDALAHLKDGLRLIEQGASDAGKPWRARDANQGPWTAWANALHWIAHVACWAGYPDQALAHWATLTARAPDMGYAAATGEILTFSLRVRSFVVEPESLAADAERASTLNAEHGSGLLGAQADILRGYAIACAGRVAEGIGILQRGLAAYDATGARLWTCYYRSLLAETCQMRGDADGALQVLTDSLTQAERAGERWCVAELHRRLGEAHRERGDQDAARRCFEEALAVAREQGAKLWEVRAATGYAHLLRDEGRLAEALALLAPVHAWFTEGFDTVPIRQARAMLNHLGHPD